MIEVKDAVRAALEFMQELYAEEDLRHLALEEIERSEDGTRWLVTLGVGGPDPSSTMSVVAGQGVPRQYRLLQVDAETGEVVSLKMRNL